jgi:hypothetical protein
MKHMYNSLRSVALLLHENNENRSQIFRLQLEAALVSTTAKSFQTISATIQMCEKHGALTDWNGFRRSLYSLNSELFGPPYLEGCPFY